MTVLQKAISLYTPKDCEELATHAYRILAKISDIKMNGEYSSINSLVSAGLKSAENGNEVIIAVPENLYDQTKYLLLTKMSVKVLRSAKIVSRLNGSIPDKKKYDLMTAIPEGSHVYLTSDGLYSPFKASVGNGSIALFSLTGKYFDESSSKYFSSKSTGSPSVEEIKESIRSIDNANLKISVAESSSARTLMKVIESISNSKAFSLVPVEVPEDSDELTANQAKSAKESGNYDYGISISDQNVDGSVSVSIANSERAKVAVVHPLKGEDFKHVLGAAIVKLSDMMSETTELGIVNPNEKPTKIPHKFLIISIIALVIAAIVCTVFCVKAYQNKAEKDAASENVSMEPTGTTSYRENPYFVMYIEPSSEETSTEEETTTEKLETTTEKKETTTEKKETTTEKKETTTEATKKKGTTTEKEETTTAKKETTTAKKETTTEKKETTTGKKETTTEKKETTTGKKETTTEKKETTTGKKETTTEKKETTTKKKETTTEKGGSSTEDGKFVFTCYGYGHGCGMSQEGAIAMAKQGSSAEEIITHYYPGTTIKTDSSTPMYAKEPTTTTDKKGNTTVTKEGITLLEFLCRTVKQEIGASSPYEALKAQAIIAYTYGKKHGFSSGQAYDSSYAYEGTRVEKAVMEVLHITSASQQPKSLYVDYGGKFAQTFYFASAAGKTANGHTVYSNLTDNGQPYLVGGVSSPETVKITTREFTTEEMRSLIKAYDSSIVLDDNPANWLKIISHDSSYSKDIGYITEIKVGNKEITGRIFREKLMKLKIKSHCFTVEYVK